MSIEEFSYFILRASSFTMRSTDYKSIEQQYNNVPHGTVYGYYPDGSSELILSK